MDICKFQTSIAKSMGPILNCLHSGTTIASIIEYQNKNLMAVFVNVCRKKAAPLQSNNRSTMPAPNSDAAKATRMRPNVAYATMHEKMRTESDLRIGNRSVAGPCS